MIHLVGAEGKYLCVIVYWVNYCDVFIKLLMCSSALLVGACAALLVGTYWCWPVDSTRQFGPFGSTRWLAHWTVGSILIGSTFTLACGLESEFNMSFMMVCLASESDMYCYWRYFIYLHERHWDMLHCTYAGSRGWLYLHWNYHYAQLYWTKLIIAYIRVLLAVRNSWWSSCFSWLV